MNELLKAVKRGDQLTVRKLIASHAALNQKDSQGWTPLFMAAGKGDAHVVQLLIDAGVDVNDGDETGFTALFSAVISGHVKVVRLLLGAGASAMITVQGAPLTKWVMMKGARREQLLQMLRQAGAKE
jgi:ankyrin repeat protein